MNSKKNRVKLALSAANPPQAQISGITYYMLKMIVS